MGWLLVGVAAVLVIASVAAPTVRRAAERRAPRPEHRPIEEVARDARRLRQRFCATRTGVSFAKAEGVRRAYDGVLAEGADALGVVHLLAVLDGDELDAERLRVERLLHRWGMALDDAA